MAKLINKGNNWQRDKGINREQRYSLIWECWDNSTAL